jgi:outer membrane protein assembly factor BamA
VNSINRAARDTADLIEQIKPVVEDAASVSHRQLARADQVLSDVLTRVEAISENVEKGIVQPAREIQAISAALRRGLAVFFRHPNGSKGPARTSSPLGGWSILLLSLNLAGISIRLRAQAAQQQVSYEGEKVAFVDLVGRPDINVEALRPVILQKVGELYSNEKVQSSVTALEQAGQFSKVDVEVTPEAEGLRVAFVVQPAFYIGIIDFPGALRDFNYPRLLQVVNYPAQEPYEASRINAAEVALLNFFPHNGYFQARVVTETKLDEAHRLVDVVFQITLNRRAKLGRIEIEGAPPKEASHLQQALRSYRARLKGAWLKSGKPYDAERLQAATTFIRDTLAKEDRLASQVGLQPAH